MDKNKKTWRPIELQLWRRSSCGLVVLIFALLGCQNTEENIALSPLPFSSVEKTAIDSIIKRTQLKLENVNFRMFERATWVNNNVENQKFVVLQADSKDDDAKKNKTFFNFCP